MNWFKSLLSAKHNAEFVAVLQETNKNQAEFIAKQREVIADMASLFDGVKHEDGIRLIAPRGYMPRGTHKLVAMIGPYKFNILSARGSRTLSKV